MPADPYAPTKNPYTPEPPPQPGTPDDLMDGPTNDSRMLDLEPPSNNATTSRPRQKPTGGGATDMASMTQGFASRRTAMDAVKIICRGCNAIGEFDMDFVASLADTTVEAVCEGCGSDDLDLATEADLKVAETGGRITDHAFVGTRGGSCARCGYHSSAHDDKGEKTAAKSDECPKCGAHMDDVTVSGDTLKASCGACGWSGTKKKASTKTAAIEAGYYICDRDWSPQLGPYPTQEAMAQSYRQVSALGAEFARLAYITADGAVHEAQPGGKLIRQMRASKTADFGGLSTDMPMDVLDDGTGYTEHLRCSSCFHEFDRTVNDADVPMPNCPSCGSEAVAIAPNTAGITWEASLNAHFAALASAKCPECNHEWDAHSPGPDGGCEVRTGDPLTRCNCRQSPPKEAAQHVAADDLAQGGGALGFLAWLQQAWHAAKNGSGNIPSWFPRSLLTPEEQRTGRWMTSGAPVENAFASKAQAKVDEIVAGILTTNPSMDRTAARKLAETVIERYPKVAAQA